MNKELKDYTVEELKALGFDIKNNMELQSQNLQVINQELQRRANEEKPKKKDK